MSVLVTDLDDFKRINDVHGHIAGDDCIRQAADALRATVRGGEGCFRWGGDEFAVVVQDAVPGAAAILAARVEAAVSEFGRAPDGAPLTLTCGYTEVGGESTPADAVAAADDVLRSLKSREPVG